MASARRVPAAGINLFQLIYVLIREYSEKTGLPPLNLSLGNPDGVPPEAVLELQARFAADPAYDYHTYAEDKNLCGFAEAMVRLHSGVDVARHPHLRVLPTAGIKTATALLPLACGLHLPDAARRSRFSVASNLPAYDVAGTWTERYLGAKRIVWPLLSSENMRLSVAGLREALRREKEAPDLVFVIRPGNPAAVGATEQEWRALIELCMEKGMRLVNDAAYAGLVESGSHVSLASVAQAFPGLEWMELYSVSKSFNDPGARLGALVGSKEFVEDFVMIKGNTDSGPVPSIMAAYGTFLRQDGAAERALAELRALYQGRLDYVIPRLEAAGLRPACKTEAGFFTLWKVPRRVLGVDLSCDPRTKGLPLHEAYNRLVISETGLVGVHFEGFAPDREREPLIRYAVCADVLDGKFRERFEGVLSRLKPEY